MGFELHDHVAIDRLQRKNIPYGSKVFICSTFELFHPKVPKSWRKDIFRVIECNPKITFQILTKFPQNIDRPMPENVWLGVTVTGADETGDCFRVEELDRHKAKIKFISYEPILDYSGFILFVDWLIMGRLTRFGHKYDPRRHWIEEKIRQAKKKNIPIFFKDNLKEIWGEPLIQEFPNVAEESICQQNINS